MKLIRPYVDRWDEKDHISHVLEFVMQANLIQKNLMKDLLNH